MDMLEIMKARHSVRQYTDQAIESEKRNVLNELAKECNMESGLNIQLIYDEPKCFNSMMAHYGKFSGCSNYIAVVGKKGRDLDEKAGYYGEKLVLKAQELGLNTCWVAMTHGKAAVKLEKGEKLAILISLGYGQNQGAAHRSKQLSDVCNQRGEAPDWFMKGRSGFACSDCHESAEVSVSIRRRAGNSCFDRRLIFENRSWYCKISF